MDIKFIIRIFTSNDCNQAAMRRGGHNPTDIEVRREKRNIGISNLERTNSNQFLFKIHRARSTFNSLDL